MSLYPLKPRAVIAPMTYDVHGGLPEAGLVSLAFLGSLAGLTPVGVV